MYESEEVQRTRSVGWLKAASEGGGLRYLYRFERSACSFINAQNVFVSEVVGRTESPHVPTPRFNLRNYTHINDTVSDLNGHPTVLKGYQTLYDYIIEFGHLTEIIALIRF